MSTADDRDVARPITSKLQRGYKTYRQALGAIVTKLRTEKEWSQQTLADKTGYSFSYLNGLEQGKCNPSLDVVQALAHVFKLRPSELLAQAEQKQARR